MRGWRSIAKAAFRLPLTPRFAPLFSPLIRPIGHLLPTGEKENKYPWSTP